MATLIEDGSGSALARQNLGDLGDWWDDAKSSLFGDDETAQVKADLARLVSAMVALKEPLYGINIRRKVDKSIPEPDPRIEQAFNTLRMQLSEMINELCSRDRDFRLILPRAATFFGSSCVEIVDGTDGGFAAWRQRTRAQPVQSGTGPDDLAGDLGLPILIPIVIAVVVVALSAVGVAYFLTAEGRARMAVALKQAAIAEQLTQAMLAGKITSAQVSAILGSLPPPPAPGLGDTIGTVVKVAVVGGLIWGAFKYGPKLLAGARSLKGRALGGDDALAEWLVEVTEDAATEAEAKARARWLRGDAAHRAPFEPEIRPTQTGYRVRDLQTGTGSNAGWLPPGMRHVFLPDGLDESRINPYQIIDTRAESARFEAEHEARREDFLAREADERKKLAVGTVVRASDGKRSVVGRILKVNVTTYTIRTANGQQRIPMPYLVKGKRGAENYTVEVLPQDAMRDSDVPGESSKQTVWGVKDFEPAFAEFLAWVQRQRPGYKIIQRRGPKYIGLVAALPWQDHGDFIGWIEKATGKVYKYKPQPGRSNYSCGNIQNPASAGEDHCIPRREMNEYEKRELQNPTPRPVDPDADIRDTVAYAKRIKDALKRRSGYNFSVTRGRGTAASWIEINPPKGMERSAAAALLSNLLGKPAAGNNEQIPPGYDFRREYLDRAEGRPPSRIGRADWD